MFVELPARARAFNAFLRFDYPERGVSYRLDTALATDLAMRSAS
ncbi:MAG: hypothetical protein QOF84_3270, partial [Streptomyces sp.]|nr:hypothetical protein [Streptomyces sp.]